MSASSPSPLSRDRRRAGAVVATVLAVLMGAVVVGAWGAERADATSYRFWTYWSGGSDWTFASQGAARRPADGAVEGWRFAVSPATTSTIPPRHSPSFDSLCAGTPTQAGKKRVGLVVDFGTAGDAPPGESPAATITSCAVVPSDATGYDVLMTVATLRTDQGLICGIDGYPARECGVVVSDPTPSPSDDAAGGSSGTSGGAPTAGGGQARQSDGSAAGVSGSSTSGPKDASDGGATGQDDARDSSHAEDRPRDRDGTSSPPPESAGTTAVAAESTTTAAGSGSGSPVGVLVGVGLVAALAAAAVVLRRRRS
jgi:hypothetical protein